MSHIRSLWTTSWISIDPSTEVVSFTSFSSLLEMLLQLWKKELGAVKWTDSIPWPDSKGFGLAHYLTFISSLLQILSSQKEAQSIKPDYSVELQPIVHIHFWVCDMPPPPQAPEPMVRKELIMRLVYRRAHNAAMQNQRITEEHYLLKGQPYLLQQIFISPTCPIFWKIKS